MALRAPRSPHLASGERPGLADRFTILAGEVFTLVGWRRTRSKGGRASTACCGASCALAVAGVPGDPLVGRLNINPPVPALPDMGVRQPDEVASGSTVG